MTRTGRTRNVGLVRVLTLLRLLQTKRRFTLNDLAERHRVTTRTVRRDLDVLQAVGYPVTNDKPAPGCTIPAEWWLL